MAEDTVLLARLAKIRDWFATRANLHDAHTIAAAIAALTPPPADLVYAPYWLVALRACDEALDKHSLWCGHKKDSPGDPSINRAERLIRSALRRADAEAAAPPPAEAAPEPTPAGRETMPVLVEAFRFTSYQNWVDTGQHKPWTWVTTTIGKHSEEICADSRGRVCRRGRDFQRAHDEGAFPVIAYRVQDAALRGGQS